MKITNNIATNSLSLIQDIDKGVSELLQSSQAQFPKIIFGTIVFFLLWAIALIVGFVIRKIASRVDDDRKDIVLLLSRISRLVIIIIGLISGLGTAGVNVWPLVTGLGLTGFALGFAFKDALSNVLAGFMIILHGTFVRGDVISIAGNQGKVIKIDLRYTTLKSATEDKLYLVPNTTLLTNTITILEETKTEINPVEQDARN